MGGTMNRLPLVASLRALPITLLVFALARPTAPGKALWQGVRLLIRALMVSLFLAVIGAFMAAPFALAAWGLSALFDVETHAPAHDLGILCSLAPVLLVLLVIATWHDL